MDPATGVPTRTFRVSDDAELPALDGVKGIAGTDGAASAEFSTKYFDTGDLALTKAGITLLHRSGVPDAGWRLELPTPDGGTKVVRGTGIGTNTVPKPLRDALHLHTGGATLVPIGRTRTERRTMSLVDKAGTTVARLRDDRVAASAAAPADTGLLLAWREWTVALADGKPAVLDNLAVLLEASEATASNPESEVSRILGDRTPERSDARPSRLRAKSSAAEVVGAHLREQVAELERWDVLARFDQPDSVHKLRVATRRLRSALATFRPLLDRTETDPLRDELKWIAGVLGRVRDLEVSQHYFAERIAEEPVELVLGPVTQHIDRELSAEHRAERLAAVEAMSTDRYLALVSRLRALVADPPWNRHADKRADSVIPALVAADFRRTRKHVEAAEKAEDPEARAHLLHEARKSAKRTRYAAEAVSPVFGGPADSFAAAMENLQEVLGAHHDTITLLPRLRQLGVQAHLDGENAFTYGRLHGLEEARIAELEAEYRETWAQASAKKLRRWLE